ncbi:sugar phosphate isomerase/epimerase family protein [Colwellia echini]|uniref:Sugar phosphate isomerase/epimerase n=1 Tax=Colwellia echini TaxID=1982103 RepID=A0ABY3MUS4_9GAMM|nr:sugar phosphate isomerase/epimerase [Colwellia echini]TYK64842.1 sugar phosphate isomerase/epimerase [Colwellia echini]
MNKLKLMICSVIMSMSCLTQAADSVKVSGIETNSVKTYKNKAIPKISVQLWSVKDALKNDFKGTLKQIAAMGFDGVEFAGDFGPYKNDPKGLKIFLDGLGLQVSAAHVSFTDFSPEKFDQAIIFYNTLDTDTLIVPWDERAWDSAQVDNLIVDLNKLFTQLNAEEFKFGYHNHDQEFDDFKETTFWDHIAQSTPKDFVLQMDVGWVTYAEKDPVEYINRYPNRTLTTHIKAKLPKAVTDKADADNKRPIVGDDVTDWSAVLIADIMVGGTQWLVIEQEEYPDGLTPLQAVKLSKQGLDKAIASLNN